MEKNKPFLVDEYGETESEQTLEYWGSRWWELRPTSARTLGANSLRKLYYGWSLRTDLEKRLKEKEKIKTEEKEAMNLRGAVEEEFEGEKWEM